MPLTWAIHTEGLTKQFPAHQGWRGLLAPKTLAPPAVDRVTLQVAEGELFGLVGPNGAGKTTLIKLLATLIVPTSGTASVNGHPLQHTAAIKASLGLVTSDERSFYWRLTGRQNLAFFAALHGLPPQEIPGRVEATLALMGLESQADTRFQTYSTGMRQRLSIARALLHRPRLLFLDEPTKGLDPAATRQLHALIRDELTGQRGLTVFLTTHWLAEAEALCDRIAVIHQGRIRACGTLDELRTSSGLRARYELLASRVPPAIGPALQALAPGVQLTEQGDHRLLIAFADPQDPVVLNGLLDRVREAGSQIEALTRQPVSLESIYTRLTESASGEDLAGQTFPPVEAPTAPAGDTPPAAGARGLKAGLVHAGRVAWATLRRDVLSEVSYRFSFLLQFLGVFFSVAVFYFVAQLLGEAAAPFLAPYGGDYFAFVLIGIAFAGYFGVGLSGFSSSLRNAQTTGTLEAMLTTPTGVSTIILSASLWDYLLTTVRVLVYLSIGGLFLGVDLGQGNYPAALAVLVLTIISFSSLGILAASFIMVLKRGDPVTWAIGAFSTLLGGVYYPIAVLPGWMQALSRLIPVTYALEAMRLALLQGASFAELLPDILALAVFSAIFLPASLVAFRYAVGRARVDGSLTHY